MVGLVELAQRYISLSAELEATRTAIAIEVSGSNGADSNPPPRKANGAGNARARPTRRAARPGTRWSTLANAATAEEKLVSLLKDKTMSQAEIARATGSPLSTTAHRLKRLKAKSLIDRREDGWRTIAS
jgi:hypothetical protein